MKTILIILAFSIFISCGIFLDSLLVNLIASFIPKEFAAWINLAKVALWVLISFFTGGIIFAISFIAAGAIKTALEK